MRELGLILAVCVIFAASIRYAGVPDEEKNKGGQSYFRGEIEGLASIVDGDTITIKGYPTRLAGIDAPGHGARCGEVMVAQRAAQELQTLIEGRTVTCRSRALDRFDRTVASCTVNGVDLGEHMVRSGWARDWPRYSRGAYADEERDARRAQRGLWALSCPADLWGARNYAHQPDQ